MHIIERARHFVTSNGGLRNTLRIALRKVIRCGPGDALRAVLSHASPVPLWPQRRYRRYRRLHETPPAASDLADRLAALGTRPRIALLSGVDAAWIPDEPAIGATRRPPASPEAAAFHEGLRSVLDQIYPAWELWLVVEDTAAARLRHVVSSPTNGSAPVHVEAVPPGHSRIETLNIIAREKTQADYVAFFDPRDRLREHTLLVVAETLAHHPGTALLYTDEDRLDRRTGERREPRFKPQGSPDTLLSYPYTGDLTVFLRSRVVACGILDETMAPAEIYDLTLKVTETTDRILRIPGVLYHRVRPEVGIPRDTATRVRDAALRRRHTDAVVRWMPGPAGAKTAAIAYRIRGTPKVSILIPTRNHAEDLRRCVTSIEQRSTYPNRELLILDNGSDEPETRALLEELRSIARVLPMEMPFHFARLNNRGSRAARGEFLLFLNNDTEVITPDWIEWMLGFAQQEPVGAVGARLLYPDGTIQHAGVARVGPGPTHVFARMPETYPHPRLHHDGNWSAVTGACLMVDRRKFEHVGGFDEAFPVAYNDVDLCLHLMDAGWRNVLATHARLYHREFATRGHDGSDPVKRAALETALRRLDEKWPWFRNDPMYNPNLSDSFPDFMPRN